MRFAYCIGNPKYLISMGSKFFDGVICCEPFLIAGLALPAGDSENGRIFRDTSLRRPNELPQKPSASCGITQTVNAAGE